MRSSPRSRRLPAAAPGSTCCPACRWGSPRSPERVAARRLCANALPERLDPGEELLLEELDSRLLAGEVKLRLLEYFPDGWEAFVSEMGEDGAFSRRAVPLCELDRQKRYGPTTVAYVPAALFEKLERYGFDELLSVLRRLRAPGGCPWDREQTHETIKESLLEECYEAMDAIDRGDDVDLAEELGDVLLQVAFHAEIAREQGRFTARDVTTGLVQKLVYRHPHVFGSVRADTSEQVLKNWDALKKVEKKQQSQADVLESVPKNFPALLRSRKVQKRAAAVGFDWDSAADAFYKIGEEAEELSRAMGGRRQRGGGGGRPALCRGERGAAAAHRAGVRPGRRHGQVHRQVPPHGTGGPCRGPAAGGHDPRRTGRRLG